jgi:hypothetical protein
MTLVVGYADSGIGFLVGDSLLTPVMANDLNKGPVVGKFHGLKIHIIHPHIAIAYASSNDAGTAVTLIRELAEQISVQPADDVPERLFNSYRQMLSKAVPASAPDCEFLVLEIKSHEKKLTHVNKAGALSCTRAYIGDPIEYKKLTELRKPLKSPNLQLVQQEDGTFITQTLVSTAGEDEFAEISDAMIALVHQRRPSLGAIGGCVIRVVDARISKNLEYLQEVEASESPAEGSAGFSLLASNSGLRGVGIYYPAGKLGFMLFVGDAEYVRKEYAATMDEFIRIGTNKYGLELTGPKGGNWQ